MTSLGEFVTRWTVRAALAFFVAGLALRSGATAGSARRRQMARLSFTLGCVLYLAHVACAFQFYHGWSHDRAYHATAAQTRQRVGLDWGGGLYLNYAFTVVWVAEVSWWWLNPRGYLQRPPAVSAGVYGFLLFMWFNATVIFGAGAIRWVGAAVAAAWLPLWLAGLARRPTRGTGMESGKEVTAR